MAKTPGQLASPQIVPVKSIACGPADFGTQGCNEVCFCGDAGGFVIKKDDHHHATPHCEWFCSKLALAASVPQLEFAIVEHTDGNLWFGSSWAKGKIDDWWIQAKAGHIRFQDLAADLSRIYALDLFINNIDRHMRNYIVREENNVFCAYSMDYDQSWLRHGFPPAPIMTNPAIATVQCKEWMKTTFGSYPDKNEMNLVLDNLLTLKETSIEYFINCHPKPWLSDPDKNDIVKWWKDGFAASIIHEIKNGIANGSLL